MQKPIEGRSLFAFSAINNIVEKRTYQTASTVYSINKGAIDFSEQQVLHSQTRFIKKN